MRSIWNTGAWAAVAVLALAGVAAAQQPDEKRELLSRHETVAEFTGTRYHQCMGKTSLCPDRCGSSGTVATFRIVTYLHYEKPGKYGDPEKTEFVVMIENNMKEAKVSAEIRKTIDTLQPGDRVLLSWNHDYVTIGRSSRPERPIVKLEKAPPDA